MTEYNIPPLVKTLQTVKTCPSEWSAWDADGNWYYLRYRSGYGTVHVSIGGPPHGADDQAFMDALSKAKLLTDFVYGDPHDSEITLDVFLRMAGMKTAV